jgi:hypothetical protein
LLRLGQIDPVLAKLCWPFGEAAPARGSFFGWRCEIDHLSMAFVARNLRRAPTGCAGVLSPSSTSRLRASVREVPSSIERASTAMTIERPVLLPVADIREIVFDLEDPISAGPQFSICNPRNRPRVMNSAEKLAMRWPP